MTEDNSFNNVIANLVLNYKLNSAFKVNIPFKMKHSDRLSFVYVYFVSLNFRILGFFLFSDF